MTACTIARGDYLRRLAAWIATHEGMTVTRLPDAIAIGIPTTRDGQLVADTIEIVHNYEQARAALGY